jgi:predicted kinase
MKYLNSYKDYIITENSKNDPLPEITQVGKLGIILIGAPGIGKSTFAKNYITHKNQNIKIFSTDDVSLTLTKQHDVYRQGSSELNLKRLYMFMKSGGSFIYDTTGVQKENVNKVTQTARDNGYNVIYVHLMGTLDLSMKQNLQRERNVPTDYIKHAYDEQFKNMRYFSSLNPDTYYVVYNLDGKYKFMKYDGQKLFKRFNDKYK